MSDPSVADAATEAVVLPCNQVALMRMLHTAAARGQAIVPAEILTALPDVERDALLAMAKITEARGQAAGAAA